MLTLAQREGAEHIDIEHQRDKQKSKEKSTVTADSRLPQETAACAVVRLKYIIKTKHT
jgi:hypothetical protein